MYFVANEVEHKYMIDDLCCFPLKPFPFFSMCKKEFQLDIFILHRDTARDDSAKNNSKLKNVL